MSGATKAFVKGQIEKAKESLLEGGKNEDAVIALTELWAKLPSTRLATIIEKISARLPHEELPKRVSDRELHWIAIAEKKDPRTVPTLLSVDWPAHPAGVKDRLNLLVDFPPDPRIARALRELWIGGRYRSRAGEVFWRRAFRLLLNWKDPETSRVIGSAKTTDDGYFIVEPIILKRTKTPLPPEPELTPELAAAFEEIEGLAGITPPSPKTEKLREELYEDVYANPWSDEPRLVLGDLLVQEGDTRGELIQLMNAIENGRATSKIEKRVHVLLRDSAKKWLDGIGGAVSDPKFRSGFVTDVVLNGKVNPDLPGWRTVETIYFAGVAPDFEADAFGHPNLRGLRRIYNADFNVFLVLLNLDRGLDYVSVTSPLGVLGAIKPKLDLKELAISPDEENEVSLDDTLRWFSGSPFKNNEGMKLEIDVAVDEESVQKALRYMRETPSLAQLTLKLLTVQYFIVPRYPTHGWELQIRRDETGEPSIMEAIFHQASADRSLGVALAALPSTTLTSFTARAATTTTTTTTAKPLPPKQIEARTTELHAALKKQTRLATKDVFGAGL